MQEDIFSLGELFEQVQIQNIFSDGKTFVDCTPRPELSFIHQRYEEQKHEAGFKLSTFVHEHFIQIQNIFSDGKTFVDCTPRPELSFIHQRYEEQKHEAGFKLSTFVHEHFILPKTYSTKYVSVKGRPIVE